MTASVALPLQWAGSDARVAPDPATDPTDRASAETSFGQLLNALLSAGPNLPDGDADLTAGGGAIANMPERFEAAPLLSGSELHSAEYTAGRAAQPEASARPLPLRAMTGSLGSSAQLGRSLQPLSAASAPGAQTAATMAMESVAGTPGPAASTPGARAEPKITPSPAPPLPPLPELSSAARAEQTSAPAPGASDRAGGSVSRFGLHLLQNEHGPVLVMRLPKLTAEERVELEAQIARLFEAFGQRKHKLVLRELAGG